MPKPKNFARRWRPSKSIAVANRRSLRKKARGQHEQALQALKKERDELLTQGEALQTELVGVRKECGQLKTDLNARAKVSAAEKDSLSKELAAAHAEFKKIGSALEEQRSAVANAKKESNQDAAARNETEPKVTAMEVERFGKLRWRQSGTSRSRALARCRSRRRRCRRWSEGCWR